MSETASPVFTVGDLSAATPSLLLAARAGGARLQDIDGTTLAVLPEDRLDALTEIVRWATRHLLVEAMLRRPATDRSETDFGDTPWLRAFDDQDLSTFAAELGSALLVAAKEASTTGLLKLIDDWQVTAAALSDPDRREVLLGRHGEADFVEVARPG